jgi:hypothetical protein
VSVDRSHGKPLGRMPSCCWEGLSLWNTRSLRSMVAFTLKAVLGPFGDGFRQHAFVGIFSAVLDPNFHGSFSVGHCPGNCLFHWVFWELAPFFEDS